MFTLQSLAEEARQLTQWTRSVDYERKFDKHEQEILASIAHGDWKEVRDFILVCVEVGSDRVVSGAAKLLEKRKLIDWKAHPEIFVQTFEAMGKYGMTPADDELLNMGDYCKLADSIVSLLKVLSILVKFEEHMFGIVMKALSTDTNRLHLPAIKFANVIQWNKHADWCKKVMQRTNELVRDNAELSENHVMAQLTNLLWVHMLTKSIGNVKLAEKYVAEVTEVFAYCADQEWIDPDDPDRHTLQHQLCSGIMSMYLIHFKEKPVILKPMFSTVKRLWECDDEELQRNANSIVTSLGTHAADVLGDDVDLLIERYLNGEQPSLIAQFHQMYPTCRQKFAPRVDEFCEAMSGAEDWVVSTTLNIFWEIAKTSPQSFSSASIQSIVDALERQNTSAIAMLALQPLAAKRANDVAQHDDVIIARMLEDSTAAAQGGQILVSLSSLSQKHASKYMAAMKRMVETHTGPIAMGILYNMRTIGASNPDALVPHKAFFEGLLDNASLREHAQGVLDTMAGRTLENISKDVDEQREDIEQLDTRVTSTEENVTNMAHEVDVTSRDVNTLRRDVDDQDVRLTEVQYVVDETVDKVDEIDKKTLSHAPRWSRDVARLMNVDDEHDWRLLAGRLGYTNDDIRNWATQPDPCLSLLDEWFATHKTREATFAVLKALQEMDRNEVAMIVENALKSTEDVVDDDEEDSGPPPPVFISYQWGHQPEVKLLKQHLEMAGYPCWMDIGQMGGGDKLFAKIDQGIRAAQVVICCVTEKYAESPNCNREVNLSVTLGKPIIPLLMEKLSWPPPGAMGPIFGEYLFIRFFARPGEGADNQYWPPAKFTELLMQIRLSVAPDHHSIQPEYENWWSPPDEVIVIKPRDQHAAPAPTPANKTQPFTAASSPEVFISYQWGKQPQIKALYRQLCHHGYTCWLDVMQMGGGDSLYDKIDKGVRGCSVVISCVTSKYSLSANCRREVSLADALKKPIIPLLLEQITWPPEGPMSMVFTQLLYISFCKPSMVIQDHWKCPQFDELLSKIELHIPTSLNDTQEGDDVTQQKKAVLARVNNNGRAIEGTNDSEIILDDIQNVRSPDQFPARGKSETKKSGFCSVL